MKKHFLFLILVFVGIKTPAQIDVAWGSQQTASPKNSVLENILGGNESKVYALKTKNKGSGSRTHYYIDTYSKKSLKLLGTAEYSLPIQNERSGILEQFFLGAGKFRTSQIEKIIYTQGKFLVFTSFYSKTRRMNYAYLQTISENGILDPSIHAVDSISADSRRNAGQFNFILSSDKMHLLIAHTEPLDMHPFEKFSCTMLDEHLTVSWKKDFELPYKDKQFHLAKYCMDSTGNLFMLVNIDKNKENQERKKPAYSYSIFAYFCKRDQLREYTLDLGEKFISEITCDVSPSGDFICAGFYSRNSESSQAGTFYLKIDKTSTEVAERNVHEFDKDFLMEFIADRTVNKGRELYNFDIHYLLLRQDGSAVMIAEQYFMDIVSYYNPASRSYNYAYHYYYNDIIVVGFDPKGQTSLLKKINKYQHTVNDGGPYSSFAMVDGGDMLHFIYNDNPDNMHRSESEIGHGHVDNMNNPSRSVVVMVSMDMKGNTQRTQLLDNHARKNKCWFMPKMNKMINRKDLILFSGKSKYYRLGRISL
jgi:hypothetical protein